MSNGERLAELSEEAANAEDTASLQTLKTMDSISAKAQQLQTSLQSMFVETGLENAYKGILDFGIQIINTFTSMPKIFKLPIPAIASFTQIFINLGTSLTGAFHLIQEKIKQEADLTNQQRIVLTKIANKEELNEEEKKVAKILAKEGDLTKNLARENQQRVNDAKNAVQQEVNARNNIMQQKSNSLFDIDKIDWNKFGDPAKAAMVKYDYQHYLETQSPFYAANLKSVGIRFKDNMPIMPMLPEIGQGTEQARGIIQKFANSIKGMSKETSYAFRMIGSSISMIAAGMDESTTAARGLKGAIQLTGGALQTISYIGNPYMMIFSAATTAIQVLSTWIETSAERLERLKKKVDDTNNVYLQKRNDYTEYKKEIDSLKELEKARYDSQEANEKYIESSNKIAEQHPELVTAFDAEGNAIIDLTSSYYALEKARQDAYKAGNEATKSAIDLAINARKEAEENKPEKIAEARQNFFTADVDINKLGQRMSAKILEDFGFSLDEISDSAKEIIEKYSLQLVQQGNEEIFGSLVAELQGLDLDVSYDNINNARKYFNQVSQFSGLGGLQNNNVLQYAGNLYGGKNPWLQEITDSAGRLDDVDNTAKLVNKYRDRLNQLSEELQDPIFDDFVLSLEGYTGVIVKSNADIAKAVEQQRLSERSGIASNVRNFMYGDEVDKNKNTEAFKEFGEINSLISGYVYDKFVEYKDGLKTEAEKDSAFDSFVNDGKAKAYYDEIYGLISSIWETASTSQKEQFNSLLGNSGNYSRTQFGEELKHIFTGIDDELVQQLQEQYYNTDYSFSKYLDALVTRYQNQDFQLYGSQRSELLKSLGGDERQHILSIYDNVAAQIKAKNITPEVGQTAFNSYLDVWEETNKLDSKSREIAQNVLKKTDFSSLIGLDELRNSLESTELNKDSIESIISFATAFANLMPENLILDFETISKNMVSQIDNFEKALKNASQGMGLEDATKMADKLDLSLDDFDFRAGQYFFKNVTAIRDAYYKYNQETLDELDKQFVKELKELDIKIKITKEEGEDTTELRQERSDLITSQRNLKATINQYGDYQVNSILIQNGQIETFLKSFIKENGEQLFSDEDISTYIKSISEGELDDLPDNIKQYTTELWNFYKDGNKSIYETAINSIQDGKQAIKVDTTNQDLIKELTGIEYDIGETIFLDFSKRIDALKQSILNKKSLSPETRRSLLASVENKITELDASTILKDVANSYDNLSYELATKYARLLGAETLEEYSGSAITKDISGNYIADYNELWNEIINNQNSTLKERNEILASLAKQKYDKSDKAVLSTIIQNRDKLDEENIASLATMFRLSYDAVVDLLKANSDGTYTATLQQIQVLAREKGEDVYKAVGELIASQIDDAISSISELSSNQAKGYTNIADMQKYISQLDNLGVTGVDLNFESIFGDFDETLHAYRLSTDGLIAQIRGMKSQLDKLTGEEKEVAQKLVEDISRQFSDSIDADSLISSLGTNQEKLNREKFIKAVEDYNAVLVGMADVGEEVSVLDSEALANNIAEGGIEAITALQKIAEAQGKQITAEQAEAAWRSKINNYVNAIDRIIAKPGEIVDKTTADIINESDGLASELGNSGTYLVQISANLYKAYKDLFNQMRENGEATLADLNKVAGLTLDNKDGQQAAIDALGDAANLTYSRLGEIFTSANKLMTEELVQELTNEGLIKSLGGNKIQITDFTKIANLMGFETGSPEYVSAFKSYNDSLIEINRRAERNILEEVQNVAGAKSGDWINLTQLTNKLNEIYQKNVDDIVNNSAFSEGVSSTDKLQYALSTAFNPLEVLNKKLIQTGAYIENGILKIADNADILNIIQAIESTAQESGGLITDELAELADAVAKAISNYTNLINTGIKGSLNNQQASQLQNFANNYGIEKLDFTKTADGLKLSQNSAIELYNTISKIDSLQGQIVFDELRSSLEKSNEGLANISKTSSTIDKVQKQIHRNAEKINELEKSNEDNSKLNKLKQENKELQSQLKLYNKIAVAQSSDPNSFDFMNRKMPESFEGPINYWDSIGQAYKAMNTAASSGKMEIQDFYNIINEMSNVAQMSGQEIDFMGYKINGDLTNASELIQAGFNALSNVDGEGVQIDMGKLAASLQTGADNMGEGFDTAIKSMARSQISMLDGMINLLETIVAMEKLGDIDVDGDNILLPEDLFNISTDGFVSYTEDAQKVMDSIAEAGNSNTEIKNALDSLFFNGHSLWDYINNKSGELNDLGEEGRKKFAEAMSKILQLTKSDEFDPSDLSSITNLLQNSGLMDIFNSTYYDENAQISYIATPSLNAKIDWTKWDDNALKEIGLQSQEQAQDLLKKYASSPESVQGDELISILRLTNTIEVELDKQGNKTGNYIFNGKSLTPEELTRVIAETNKANVDMESLNYQVDGTFDYMVTLESNIDVKTIVNEKDEHTYEMPNGDIISDAGTPQEAFSKWFEANKYDENGDVVYTSEEEFVEQINATLNPEVTYKAGELTGDESNIGAILSLSRKELQEKIDAAAKSDLDNLFHIELAPGVNFAFDEKPDIDTLTSKAIDSLQIPSMIASVAEGIRTAFSNDSGATIGAAIGNGFAAAIAASVGQASIDKESKTITIPEIGVDVQKLTIKQIGALNTEEIETQAASQVSNIIIPEAVATVSSLSVNVDNSNTTVQGSSPSTILNLKSATGSVKDLSITGITTAHYDQILTLKNIEKGEANIDSITVTSSNFTPSASLVGLLSSINFSGIINDLTEVINKTKEISSVSFSNFDSLSSQLSSIQSQVNDIASQLSNIANQQFSIGVDPAMLGDITTSIETTVNVDTSNAQEACEALTAAANTCGSSLIKCSKNCESLTSSVNALSDALKKCSSAASVCATRISYLSDKIKSLGSTSSTTAGKISTLTTQVKDLGTQAGTTTDKVAELNNALTGPSGLVPRLVEAANTLKNTKFPVKIEVSARASGGGTASIASGGTIQLSLARGQNTKKILGSSYASGTVRRVLMGELGPELVASQGKYFIVGENGPEMVDLHRDAIVFNHIQTRQLLKNGRTNTHGDPITNEKIAVSMAMSHGNYPMNIKGTSMASAASALAALKELRAMWQSLLNASAKDMGSQAGRPGGGGGGGGGGGNTAQRSYIHDLEIWYNLLRQIDRIEKDISEQEQLQDKLLSDRIINGKALYTSQKKSLDLLTDEIKKTQELIELQQKHYENRLTEFNDTQFGKIFTFDENGLMQYSDSLAKFINNRGTSDTGIISYNNGTAGSEGGYSKYTFNGNILTIDAKSIRYNSSGARKRTVEIGSGEDKSEEEQYEFLERTSTIDLDKLENGLSFLATLNAVNKYGVPRYTAEEQVAILQAFGFEDYMKYDSSGQAIDMESEDAATQMVQAFWDQLDGWKDELDSLFDSQQENQEKLLELQNQQNELLQAIIDNQLKVEKSVYDAIVSREQSLIDDLQDEKEALSEANEKFLDGLTTQLERERELYSDNKSDEEITKLQRQLSILQRSGGPASQIAKLQEQIASKQQDSYFNKYQEQIDAIKSASDLQIEKLDAQIDLMTETLEYQKENGLLWKETYEWMNGVSGDKNKTGTVESILQFIQKHTDTYSSDSALQQSENLRTLRGEIEQYTTYRDDTTRSEVDSISSIDTVRENALLGLKESERFSKLWGKISKDEINEVFNKVYLETGNPNDAIAKVVDLFQYYIKNGSTKGFAYKNGGLVDYTGLAKVDGTKEHPEAFLNAEQTAALKEGFLNTSSNHFVDEINSIYTMFDKIVKDNFNNTNNNVANDTIIIEKAEVNMNVDSISNDYEAARAGEVALEKMLKIAQKSGTRSISRR